MLNSCGEHWKGCDIGIERLTPEVIYYTAGAFPKEGIKPTEAEVRDGITCTLA